MYKKDLINFDLTEFVRRNAREHLEIAVRLMVDEFRESSEWEVISDKVYEAGK